jgi:hypothetical protein
MFIPGPRENILAALAKIWMPPTDVGACVSRNCSRKMSLACRVPAFACSAAARRGVGFKMGRPFSLRRGDISARCVVGFFVYRYAIEAG